MASPSCSADFVEVTGQGASLEANDGARNLPCLLADRRVVQGRSAAYGLLAPALVRRDAVV